MAEPFIGEIKMFGGSFAPRGWAFCNGQLLPISQYSTLFSLLGTTYGGDGRTTFGVPDLRGRFPMHMGQGPGLSYRGIGEKWGTETNTLTVSQMPAHTHPVNANEEANTDSPDGNYIAGSGTNSFATGSDGTTMPASSAGGGQPVNNMPPYQCVNFIIALEGLYPSRN